jgi:hypothetical protein
MCFSSGGGGGNTALLYQQQQDQQARADEEARKARIAQGRSQIDALFDRGETLVSPETSRQYTDPAKDAEAWMNYRRTGVYQQPVETITTPAVWAKTQEPFDQKFYDQRRQAYIDNYTPQLAQQFADARNQLSFALARAGLLRSSVASDKVARLNADNAVQAGTIANKAEDSVSQLRTSVEDERANLINQLNVSADPAGTANLALARTQATASQPVSYSPLGDVFSGIASGIGNFVTGVRQRSILDSFNNATKQTGSGTGSSGQGVSTVGR